MSVDLTHYLGIGVAVDPDKGFWDILDEHPEYDQYTRKSNKTRVRLITDGMCGNYAYLIYLLNQTEQYEMWNDSATKEFPLNTVETQNAIKELQEAYPLFNNGEELSISKLKIISLFHAH